MIVKLKTKNGYVFHDADEVITSIESVKIKDYHYSSLIYTSKGEGESTKLIQFRNKNGALKTAIYDVGYLLNDQGHTINSL